jgi:hypothetical protein
MPRLFAISWNKILTKILLLDVVVSSVKSMHFKAW